jgi:hypothetical protein
MESEANALKNYIRTLAHDYHEDQKLVSFKGHIGLEHTDILNEIESSKDKIV